MNAHVRTSIVLLFTALAVVGNSSAIERVYTGQEKDANDPIDFVLNHAQALTLTDDQKKQLFEMRTQVQELKNKALQSLEVRDLQQQVREADKANDQDKLKTLREQLKTALHPDGTKRDDIQRQLGTVLTDTQLAKLKQLHAKANAAHKAEN